MARAGPKKVVHYSEQFKATAVKLSGLPGVLIQEVAVALDIHPFMLSLWRKQAGEGRIITGEAGCSHECGVKAIAGARAAPSASAPVSLVR